MITAAASIIGRLSSSSLTKLLLPSATTIYPLQNSSSLNHLTRITHLKMIIKRSSLLAATTTCTQLFLLIGGIQSFATPFNYLHRNTNELLNNNNDKRLWSQATDKSSSSSSGEAILDLSEARSSGSVLTDLVTNGVPPSSKVEDCSDEGTITNGKTTTTAADADDVAENITKQPIIKTTPTSSGTKIIATDDQFIKSLPDKRHYRAITLSNQLTVLLTSGPNTDVESAWVHVRAGHFDDPPNRAGLAHFHEHVRYIYIC